MQMFGHRRIPTKGGKLKIMGMDIKRSDTPEFVQDFLEGILDSALEGVPENDVTANTIKVIKSRI